MLRITPAQRSISDRFPVASFVVNAPPERVFEIACATDPALFRPERRSHRTGENFFTSRGTGLLRAPTGQATYLLPPDQLRRFAGQHRLYFAVGSYGNARGDAPAFSIDLRAVDRAPSISISPDFTGKTLDRSRLGGKPVPDRYGAAAPLLTWGGDASPSEDREPEQTEGRYDDGYPQDLWQETGGDPGAGEGGESAMEESPSQDMYGGRSEPRGFEDGPAMRAAQRDARPATQAYGGVHDFYGEPSGYEDAPARARVARAESQRAEEPYGGRGDIAGYEDAPDLRSRGAAARPAVRFGSPRASAGAPVSPSPAPADPARPIQRHPAVARPFRDDDYDDGSRDAEGDLSERRGPLALGASEALPLTIRAKLAVMLPALAFESGQDRYGAVNADGEYGEPSHAAYQRLHHGLSFGLALFTQRSGLLGRVLRAYQRRDPAGLREAFGPHADAVLAVTGAPSPDQRLAPVDGAPLWHPRWVERFRALSGVMAFQAAQNEVAIEGIFDPILGFASALGMDTDRALGMLFDRCVHMGSGGGMRFVIEAVSPLRSREDVDAALDALGVPDVASFQRSVPGLDPSGRLGPKTHAALLSAMRARGLAPSPPVSEMLDDLVRASKGRSFQARLAALRASRDYADAVYQVG